MTESPSEPGKTRPILAFAGGVGVVATLYFGRDILIPVALAIFFCFLLAPVAGLLERRLRLGRAISALLVVGASVTAVFGFGWVVGTQAAELASELPRYRTTLITKIQSVRSTLRERFREASTTVTQIKEEVTRVPTTSPTSVRAGEDFSKDSSPGDNAVAITDLRRDSPNGIDPHSVTGEPVAGQEPVKVQLVTAEPTMMALIGLILGPVVHPLSTLGGAALLLIFFMINRDDLRDRLLRVCGTAHISLTTAALADCSRRITRFLLAQFLVNCLVGCMVGGGMFVLGVPHATLWGLLAAASRFIPYVGAFLSALLPFTLSVSLFDGWHIPLMVVGWCVLVDMLSANVLEPVLYGSRTGVSATAIVLAFLFWAWVWGGFGLFLATPITVCLVVIGKHIPAMENLYILLSDEPVLENATRYYQRLLARDAGEATKIAREFAREKGDLAAFDEVILPGLALIEYDRHSGVVDNAMLELAGKTSQALIASSQDDQCDGIVKETVHDGPPLRIAVVTNGGQFDYLIPQILKTFGKLQGIEIFAIAGSKLTSEIVEELESIHPGMVILAAIEPRTIKRLQYAFKRLRVSLTSVPVFVVVISTLQHMTRSAARLARESGTAENLTVTSLLSKIGSTPCSQPSGLNPTERLPELVIQGV
jgi:predicted PurR-regulated permease PerM